MDAWALIPAEGGERKLGSFREAGPVIVREGVRHKAVDVRVLASKRHDPFTPRLRPWHSEESGVAADCATVSIRPRAAVVGAAPEAGGSTLGVHAHVQPAERIAKRGGDGLRGQGCRSDLLRPTCLYACIYLQYDMCIYAFICAQSKRR